MKIKLSSNMQENLYFLKTNKHGSKKGSQLFDVMMGAYDAAEKKLVSIFIIHELSLKDNKNNVVLYRDDVLTVFKNVSGPQAEKM